MAKGCALSTGYLPRGGLPRNSVDRITDRPDMTSAVDRGRKASTQTKTKNLSSEVCTKKVCAKKFFNFRYSLKFYTGFAKKKTHTLKYNTVSYYLFYT